MYVKLHPTSRHFRSYAYEANRILLTSWKGDSETVVSRKIYGCGLLSSTLTGAVCSTSHDDFRLAECRIEKEYSEKVVSTKIYGCGLLSSTLTGAVCSTSHDDSRLVVE